jgi:DNA invertase Pin-like site-specific DNA recombinase
MAIDTAPAVTGTQLGYARVSTGHQSLDQQVDALTSAGVDGARVYTDKLSGTSTREERPGLAALLDYAREGDAIVVVGIDRLGRNAAEVMTTIRELGERGIVLRSLREGIDTATAAGRMVAFWRAWLSLSWSWGGSVGRQLGTHGGRGGKISVAPRRWIGRKWR